MNKFRDTLKRKVIFSTYTRQQAIIVDDIKSVPEDDNNVYFDGMFMVDNISKARDDISRVISFTKDGKVVNLEDYYAQNGAYDKDGGKKFLEALENLMDIGMLDAPTPGEKGQE